MNIKEAIKALKDGKIIKHATFVEGEWIREINDDLIDEDANILYQREFWERRGAKVYQDGWSEDVEQCKCCKFRGKLKWEGYCSDECADNSTRTGKTFYTRNGSHGEGNYCEDTGAYLGGSDDFLEGKMEHENRFDS